MIDTSDLRYGNLIIARGKQLRVTRIEGGLVQNHYDEAELEGIPLTPEILLKAGFEDIPHFTVMNSKILPLARNRHISISCVGTPNECAWLCKMDGKRVTDLVCIHNWDYDGPLYLHKLQNICADFNNELTINL